jgi:integrase
VGSVSKHGKGYRAQVARQGVRRSKVFATRREALDWAARAEWLIVNATAVAGQGTLGELLQRYATERSPKKRGERWEVIRLDKIGRDKIAERRLCDLSAKDFSDWRDRRSREVGPASVLREMQLLSAVMNVAVSDWEVLPANPLKGVRRPAKPLARDRLPTDAEIEAMRHAAGGDLAYATARALHAFLFALETAMRAGEICGLRPGDVDVTRRVARLRHTKNGRPRDVPLSSEALRLLAALPVSDPVFGLSVAQLDALFRKSRDKAAVVGLHFHDSRHMAITSLSRKLDVLALARMVGHTDLRQLQGYYNESAEDLAKRLD